MMGKSPTRVPVAAVKRPRMADVVPAHRVHLIPDQLIPWVLAASLLFGLTMLMLALTARAENQPMRGAVLPQLPGNANDFARDFFHHEVEAQAADHSLWSFHETR